MNKFIIPIGEGDETGVLMKVVFVHDTDRPHAGAFKAAADTTAARNLDWFHDVAEG